MSGLAKSAGIAMLAAIAVPLLFFEPATASAESVSCSAKAPSAEMKSVTAAESDFGDALFAKMQGSSQQETIVLSPLSAFTALALAGTGANGATRSEFETALQLKRRDLTLEDVAVQQSALRRALKPCAGTQFEMANSIWSALGLELHTSFVRIEKVRFDAEIRAVDFANPKTVADINDWVADKTAGKIAQILSTLPPQTQLVLVNALHFKGKWQQPFDKQSTVPMDFNHADGSTRPVSGMVRNDTVLYFETPALQAVALPFADPRYEMLVVLPRKTNEAAAASTLAGRWSATLDKAKFHGTKVRLKLPRMHLVWYGDLSGVLQTQGLRKAFSGEADFGGLARKPVRIDQVLHKVVFDADEEGAEGAAATAIVGVLAMPVHRPPSIDMTVDHPYYIEVREVVTGTVLFMGYIADPGA